MNDKKVALEIEIRDGSKILARQIMDQSKIIIGRIFSADFKVSDSRVSRIHALLERLDDGTVRLTDLASSHGTFVNGERIVEQLVRPQDEVQLANLSLVIRFIQVEGARLTEEATPAVKTKPSSRASAKPSPAKSKRRASTKSAEAKSVVGSAVESFVDDPEELAAAPAPVVDSQVRRTSEPTVIRSLKETARTRGVLDPISIPTDEATAELEVTVYWQETVLAVDHYGRQSRSIFIGDGPGNDYIVPSGLVPNPFEFIKVKGRSIQIALQPSMKGSARIQGRMKTVEELLRTGQSNVALTGQDIAKVRVGEVDFFLMFVPRPNPIPFAPLVPSEPMFWNVQIGVILLVILFGCLSFLYRQPIEGQVTEIPENLRKILVQEYQKDLKNFEVEDTAELEAPVENPDAKKQTGEVAKKAETVPDAQMIADRARRGGNEGEGARERGLEGKRGRPNAKNETGITNRPKVRGATRTQDGPKKARVADAPPSPPSLLDSLKNSGLGARLSQVAGAGNGNGGGGGAQGNDPFDQALSGVGGGGIRSGRGSGGSGLQGSGTGGGGTAVGVGGLGTKGFGGGATGTGRGSIPGKGDFAIGTETAEITVLGSLTREEIERVINAHRNEVVYCYQRALQADAGMSGKITYDWTIGSGGRVTTIRDSENTTGSTSLAGCLRDKIRRWKFPSPRGGSVAEVSWPWTFRPKGL